MIPIVISENKALSFLEIYLSDISRDHIIKIADLPAVDGYFSICDKMKNSVVTVMISFFSISLYRIHVKIMRMDHCRVAISIIISYL